MTKTTHWKRSKSNSSVKRKTRQLKNRVQQVHQRYCVCQDLPRSRFSPKPRSKQDQEHIFTSIQGQQEKFKQDTKGRPTGPTGSTGFNKFHRSNKINYDQTRSNKNKQDQQSQPNTKQDKVSTKTNNQTRPSKTNKNCTNNKPTRPTQGTSRCQSHLPVRLRRPVFFSILFLVCSLWLLSFFFL